MTMSWVPLLLAAWIVIDLLVVGAIVGASRKRSRIAAAARGTPLSPQVSGRPTSRLVH